jgi:hypothetical protein
MTPDQEKAFIEWATEITRAISLTCREPMIIRRLSRTMGEMWRTFGYTEIDFQGNPVRPVEMTPAELDKYERDPESN